MIISKSEFLAQRNVSEIARFIAEDVNRLISGSIYLPIVFRDARLNAEAVCDMVKEIFEMEEWTVEIFRQSCGQNAAIILK